MPLLFFCFPLGDAFQGNDMLVSRLAMDELQVTQSMERATPALETSYTTMAIGTKLALVKKAINGDQAALKELQEEAEKVREQARSEAALKSSALASPFQREWP
jgi:hypothetical protein